MTIYIHPLPNRRVAALRALTAAIYRTKKVPHTLSIFSRSHVIVDHHMSICQTDRPVACAQCASRTEAHCSASLRAWRFSAAHCSAVLACSQCASRTEAPSNGLRKFHRRERHDGTTTHSHVDFLNLIIDSYRKNIIFETEKGMSWGPCKYKKHPKIQKCLDTIDPTHPPLYQKKKIWKISKVINHE